MTRISHRMYRRGRHSGALAGSFARDCAGSMTGIMIAWVAAGLVALAGLSGCDQGHRSQPARTHSADTRPSGQATGESPAPASKRGDVRQLVRTLDILVAGNTEPATLTDWAFSIEAGNASIDDFLDQLVNTPGLGLDVAPSLIFGSYLSVQNYYVLPAGYNLTQTEADDRGRVVNYIREPCSAEQAVSVHPWWNLDSEILVCPDTYRPERWTVKPEEHDYRARVPVSCDSQVGSPEKENQPLCGCGPNLIRCLPNIEQFMRYHESIKSELRQTTAYVIANDLPIDHLFVGNETFRDRRVEMLYRRRHISAREIDDVPGQLADLNEWPLRGQWAPRPEIGPGEHAGLLTSHQLLNWSPDRRQRQRQIFEIMWCEGRNSFGATTEKIFEIVKSANLAIVHDGWNRLAHTEKCTNCHARLDYGFQFWLAYPDGRASTHYMPDMQQKGKGTLYSANIDDPRGETDLTPNAFARLTAAQPEYSNCMSQKVASYVLGDHASAEDRAAVRKAFAIKHSFKDTMRAALDRYVKQWMKNNAVPAAKPVSGAYAGMRGDRVILGKALRASLDEYCMDCHDDGDIEFIDSSKTYGLAFDLRGEVLPRELVVRMADHVAYRKMPKDADDMDDAARTEMVELLIAALWKDEDARSEARKYYLGQMRALPAHQIDVAIMSIDSSAGAETGIDWGLLERAIYPDQAAMTPGFVATAALEALAACATPGQESSRGMIACLERTLSLGRLSRWPE